MTFRTGKLKAAFAAGLVLAGAIAASSAEARPYHRGHGRHHAGNVAAGAAVAGVAGALIGGAIAASAARHDRGYGYSDYPPPRQYRSYGYGPGYADY